MHTRTQCCHSCGTLVWDALVGHSCGTLLPEFLQSTLAGHFCRPVSCGTLLWDTLVHLQELPSPAKRRIYTRMFFLSSGTEPFNALSTKAVPNHMAHQHQRRTVISPAHTPIPMSQRHSPPPKVSTSRPPACHKNSTSTPPARTKHRACHKSDDVTCSCLQQILHRATTFLVWFQPFRRKKTISAKTCQEAQLRGNSLKRKSEWHSDIQKLQPTTLRTPISMAQRSEGN